MEILLGLVVVAVVGYLFINWRRNNDPLNRKCAAEICEYLVTAREPDLEDVRAIFQRNARYKTQAQHVVSMVPVLLMNAGYPKEAAMRVVPFLGALTATLPE